MSKQSAVLVACIIAVVHLVLAGLYANITPYRTSGILMGQRDPATGGFQRIPDIGAPDERQHANYVLKLVRGEGFPVLDPNDPNLIENYQAHQPPLFYLIEAGWVKAIGVDLESSGSGLVARIPNAIIGALTVLGTFFLGLWGFRRSDVGLIGATFVALLPMNAALSGAISNDPLLFCLCTWALANIAKGCVEGWCMGIAIRVGLLVGLAIITKTTAISLLPILLLCLAVGSNRPNWKQVLACTAVLAAVSAPWLARNQSLYGDPFAISAFNEAFKGSPKASDFIAEGGAFAYWVDWVGWWTIRSFFGVFGYMDIFLNERGIGITGPNVPNSLYRTLTALGFLTLVLWLFALGRTEWRQHKTVHLICGAFLLIVFVLFLRFNAQYFQGQARYLFPAIAVFGIGVSVAVLGVVGRRWQVGLGIVAAILGVLNFYIFARLPGEFRSRTVPGFTQMETDGEPIHVLSGNDAIGLRV